MTLLDAERAEPPLHRYVVARSIPAERFLFLDDDLFLAPEQLRLLFLRLLADPAVPHGMFGQRLVDPTAKDPDVAYRLCAHGEEAEIDVLNRAYLLTRTHLDRLFRLDAALRRDRPGLETGFLDDLLVSRSGRGRPRIHDVGPFLECPSQGDRRIAVWARAGNGPIRLDAARRLEALSAAL